MRRRLLGCAALAVAVCTAVAACSSSGGSTSSSSTSTGTSTGPSAKASGPKSITIGFVTDLTGSASSGFLTSKLGIDAYLNQINAAGGVNGIKIKYILADTNSTPTGALTAVQKLVQQDNVFAIVENSSDFFGAEPYALQQGIPVVGSGIDGPYWGSSKDTNIYDSSGPTNEDYYLAAQAQFMKSQGVTACGSLGYASSPSSALAAEGFIKSCEAAGLKGAYLNTQFPFGSTNIQPIALAMKAAGVDGLWLPTVPSTSFALIVTLELMGVHLKASLLPTGYGGDILASKAAVQAGQGIDFEPIGVQAEANTAGTRQRAADLAAVGVKTDPTFAEQEAFLTLAAFVAGLKAAGSNPTRQSFMAAMNKITNFTADGLLTPPVSFRQYTPNNGCLYVVKLTGAKFVELPNMPLCGKEVKFSNVTG
jgi:branched-chain amino acid transport system substrate-binding protein